MLENLRRELARIREDGPGRRFVAHQERVREDRSPWHRIARLALGSVIVLVGVILWFIPGPGWLFVALGLAVISGEFRPLARFLDRAELAIRRLATRGRRAWSRLSALARVGLVALVLAATAAAVYVLWRWWFAP